MLTSSSRAARQCGSIARSRGVRHTISRRCAAAPLHAAGAGKHVLITGGNTGLGYECALRLCEDGYSVTLACRSDERAAAAAARLQSAVPGARVDTLRLDLADLSSVRDAAARWLDGGRAVDVLLNNAGIMACPQLETKDGFELQLGTNHLGHFAFTNLLLPGLLAGGQPTRIVNVSSTAHQFGKMQWDDIMYKKNYSAWPVYGQSKLANLLFTYELSRRLPPRGGLTTNALHPGVVRTELARYLMPDPDALSAKLLGLVLYPFTKSVEDGARTSLHLAASPDAEGVSGKYYVDSKPATSTAASYDVGDQARLWALSEELTGVAGAV